MVKGKQGAKDFGKAIHVLGKAIVFLAFAREMANKYPKDFFENLLPEY